MAQLDQPAKATQTGPAPYLAHRCGLPGDPAMPGFGAALDPAAMAALFERHLLPAFLSCRNVALIRFRHRQGERLIVSYAMETQHRATGERRVRTLTGRIHPRRALPRLQAPDARRNGAELPSSAVIPPLAMVVDVFPHDKRMPRLSAYVEPGSAALAALMRNIPELVQCEGGRVAKELLRYRPSLSATLRISPVLTRSPQAAAQHYYLKLTADDELAREIAAAARINEMLKARASTLRMAQPAAWNERDSAAIYLAARGIPLDEELSHPNSATALAGPVAIAIADLHTLDASGWPAARTSMIAGKVEKARGLISWAVPELASDVNALARMAGEAAASPVRALVHGDMKPDHLFVDPASGSVQLIDSGSLCLANPLTDLASMLARLAHLVRIGRHDRHQSAQFCDALAEAYFRKVPAHWRPALGAARAYAALMIARHIVQAHACDWREMLHATIGEELRIANTRTDAP